MLFFLDLSKDQQHKIHLKTLLEFLFCMFICDSLWNVSRKWPRFCLETHKHYYGNGHFSLRNTSIVSVARVICLWETHIQSPNRQDEHIVYQAQFPEFTWRSEPCLMKNSPCWLWGLLWIHRSFDCLSWNESPMDKVGFKHADLSCAQILDPPCSFLFETLCNPEIRPCRKPTLLSLTIMGFDNFDIPV